MCHATSICCRNRSRSSRTVEFHCSCRRINGANCISGHRVGNRGNYRRSRGGLTCEFTVVTSSLTYRGCGKAQSNRSSTIILEEINRVLTACVSVERSTRAINTNNMTRRFTLICDHGCTFIKGNCPVRIRI